jgi:excisionase family DNA binding protein
MMGTTRSTMTAVRSELTPVLSFGAGGFYSVSEAAAMTKTGQETIRRAIRAGRIPAFGTKGRLRVRLSDVMPEYVPERSRAHGGRT